MKKLKKISLSDIKIMDAQEMKMILGGSGSGSGNGSGNGLEGGSDFGGGFDGTGIAKSCSDHKTKEECFGPMVEDIGGKLVPGGCEWKIIPQLKYAGCVFVQS